MHKRTAQKQAILRHLKEGKTITPLEALKKYGCFRLGARIYELRNEGHPIETIRTMTKGKSRIATYKMLN